MKFLKSFLIFFLLSFNFYSFVNAEQGLNISETYIPVVTEPTVLGSFTTGDIASGTTTTLKLEGRDTHVQGTGRIYVYINGVEVLTWQDISLPYEIDRVTVYTNPFTIEPNTTYEVSVRIISVSGYIRNLYSTTDFSNEKPVITSITSDVTSIDINNESDVGFNLSGIYDIDSSDNVSFRYSFDNENYYLIDGTLAGPVSNGSFSFNLNLYDRPEGNVTVYVKANDGKTDGEPVQITLMKDTTIPNPQIDLDVVDLDVELGTKQLIMISEYGAISYNINKDGLCDNTLDYIDLESDLVFEYGADNGKYVCYKVIFGKGQELYHLSPEITGIEGIMEYRRGDIFGGFELWKSSSLVREGDKTLSFLKLMVTVNSNGDKNYPSTLIDINGDGLIDMLYTNYSTWVETRFSEQGTTYDFRIHSYKYAIMINNGDYSFTPVYRCAYKENKYYGDCVDLAEIEQ